MSIYVSRSCIMLFYTLSFHLRPSYMAAKHTTVELVFAVDLMCLLSIHSSFEDSFHFHWSCSAWALVVVWVKSWENFGILEQLTTYNKTLWITFMSNSAVKQHSHIFDSMPLNAAAARLKECVLLEPGSPTIISGVLVQQQAMMQKRFSFNALVFAIPGGSLIVSQ